MALSFGLQVGFHTYLRYHGLTTSDFVKKSSSSAKKRKPQSRKRVGVGVDQQPPSPSLRLSATTLSSAKVTSEERLTWWCDSTDKHRYDDDQVKSSEERSPR